MVSILQNPDRNCTFVIDVVYLFGCTPKTDYLSI